MWREALLELFFSTAFVNYELITLGRATKINKGPKPKTKEKSLYFPLFPRRRLLGRVNSSDSWFSDSTAEREGDSEKTCLLFGNNGEIAVEHDDGHGDGSYDIQLVE